MLVTLKKRAEFLAVRGGSRCATQSFVVEAKARQNAAETSAGPRFGFTVTKKMGKAVIRNRIRRRLRAIVQLIGSRSAHAGYDYVLIARPSAATRPFADLKKDLEHALHRVHHPKHENKPRR